MAFLNLDFDYFDHPKTTRLVGLLGHGSEILPIRLWTHIAKFHAKDGILSGYTPEAIEQAIRWQGKSGDGVAALLSVGFIEKVDGGYQVHDWNEHQGHIHALKIRNKKVAQNRWKNIRNSTFTVDTSGIPKSTIRVPLSFPILSFPKDLKDTPYKPPETPPAMPEIKPSEPPKHPELKPPRKPTGVQEVVRAFKITMKVDENDKAWDKVYYRRYSRPANDLLGLFGGDLGMVCDCIEAVSGKLEKKGLSWTPETIVKHAGDFKNGRLMR